MASAASQNPGAQTSDPPDSPGREREDEPASSGRNAACVVEQQAAELQALRARLRAETDERERMERALRQSEARARQAENRLRQAIESVSAGITICDAHDRLVLANQRYRDLYPTIAADVRPGVPLVELARRFAASGSVPEAVGREEEWVAERIERTRSRAGKSFERQLADGRWLRISDHRTAGGGLVSLHSDVTEFKRQADELRARDAQLRGIIDNIPGVVYRRIRHPDGSITYPYHSSQLEVRHGFNSAAVANDARLLQDAVHPDDRAAWLAAIEESAQRLTPFVGDYRISVRGGEFRWFRTLATPVRQADGAVVWDGVSIDVSEVKATEQALRESEERYRRLIEAGPIALLTHRAGQVSFANARALELFGTTRSGDLVGRALLSLAHPDDAAIARELSEPVPPSDHAEGPRELRIVRLDGRVLDVEAVSVAITEDGAPAVQIVLLDITERKRSEQRVRHLAHHDALTGLPNRILLLDRLRQALRQARRERGRIAVVMLDLDHFKDINDALGHPGGDRLLRAVADRLRTTIRESDTLARFGGDEFTVVQTRLNEPRGAEVLAGKISAALALPFVLDGHVTRITTSIGVAIYPDHGSAPEPLIEHADIALYRAKAEGRNRSVIFADAMKDDILARRAVAGSYATDPRD